MEGNQQHDASNWFMKNQLQSVIRDGVVPEWFHGIISRKKAEELLSSKPAGYFLIRVSESRIGYTLSIRVVDRCSHFMIDVLEDGQYIILGENRSHRLLQDLVDYHRRHPIMPFDQVLTVPCAQSSASSTDYAELLFPQKGRVPEPTVPQKSDPLFTQSPPDLKKEGPPALPYRTQTPSSSGPPVAPGNKLYPNLETSLPDVHSPPSTTTRKRFVADAPPAKPPPVQNQPCVRTVSAPQSSCTPPAWEQAHANVHSGRNHEVRLSVVTNLKNLKKKFQKMRNPAAEANPDAAHEYQEIADAHLYSEVTLLEDELPPEYNSPPPFAPGF
ncbi:hematopoietic SH2 domain-containing protein homolog [Oryzias latipes]|uniref:Hematopoietic SH2 domain containing n=1 Tax=Oryzias latipes TaxID=8090 RepID=A0A3B3HK81_ORYLA|nr:hematopoietic SH2 domain-containing protein homolog [Oryzias latipes]